MTTLFDYSNMPNYNVGVSQFTYSSHMYLKQIGGICPHCKTPIIRNRIKLGYDINGEYSDNSAVSFHCHKCGFSWQLIWKQCLVTGYHYPCKMMFDYYNHTMMLVIESIIGEIVVDGRNTKKAISLEEECAYVVPHKNRLVIEITPGLKVEHYLNDRLVRYVGGISKNKGICDDIFTMLPELCVEPMMDVIGIDGLFYDTPAVKRMIGERDDLLNIWKFYHNAPPPFIQVLECIFLAYYECCNGMSNVFLSLPLDSTICDMMECVKQATRTTSSDMYVETLFGPEYKRHSRLIRSFYGNHLDS